MYIDAISHNLLFFSGPKVPASEDEKREENLFVDAILNKIFEVQNDYIVPSRKRRDVSFADLLGSNSLAATNASSNSTTTTTPKPQIGPPVKPPPKKMFFTITDISQTRLTIAKGLKHFTKYKVKIRACQDPPDPWDVIAIIAGNDKSMYAQHEFRTKPKPKADNIEGGVQIVGHESHKAGVDGKNKTEPVTEVYVTWTPPADPNLLVIQYNVKISNTREDSTGPTDCVSAKAFEENHRKWKPSGLTYANSFYVRVQAVSLAGAGDWTEPKHVPMNSRGGSAIVAIVVPILIFLAFLVVLGSVLYLKFFNKRPEITIMNEFYQPVREEICYLIKVMSLPPL